MIDFTSPQSLARDLAAARHENERLRKALEQIAWETCDDKPPYRAMDRKQMSDVAKRALSLSSTQREGQS